MSESIPTESELPDSLISRDQWLCWRSEERDGKMTKIPVDPASGTFASTTDSATWSDFETARNRATRTATEAVGIGFVFVDSGPNVGVDLDDCRIQETGKTREWATDIIERLDSFTEISPSGTGYHVLVEGSLPEGRNRKGDIELYETARFFTVTGDHVEGTPEDIRQRQQPLQAVHSEYVSPSDSGGESSSSESNGNTVTSGTEPDPSANSLPDQELIERAKDAANGEKFSQLWRGNTGSYESHSEADMALCSILAFWTGGDASQLDSLFRESGLMRGKWDEQHFADGSTYGEKTIERAIAGTSEFYEPPAEDESNSTEFSQDDSDDRRRRENHNGNPNQTKDRESERLDRIEELETKLRETLDENERLQSKLEAERERRRKLEAKLEANRESDEDEDGSWVPWH